MEKNDKMKEDMIANLSKLIMLSERLDVLKILIQ
jgi:hypothetical protein